MEWWSGDAKIHLLEALIDVVDAHGARLVQIEARIELVELLVQVVLGGEGNETLDDRVEDVLFALFHL